MSRPLKVDPATRVRYVPLDYDGEVGYCGVCGNPAPASPRRLGGIPQCTPCFVGGVANNLVSKDEARMMRRELLEYLRERGPVNRGGS